MPRHPSPAISPRSLRTLAASDFDLVVGGAGRPETLAADPYLPGIAAEILMGEYSALWRACGTRGVDDAAGLIFREVIRQERCRGIAGSLMIGDDIILLQGPFILLLPQGIVQIQRLVGQQMMDIGVLQDICDFAPAELEIDRDGRGTERYDRHIRIDIRSVVAGEDRYVVVCTHPGSIETVTTGSCSLLQLAIGDAASIVNDSDILAFAAQDEFMNKHR